MRRGNLKLMKVMYLIGVDVNTPACDSWRCPSPIVLAAWYGQNEAVLYLLDKGADVNTNKNWGNTALMMAAFGGKESTVKLLLSKGADVNIENDGMSALTWAKRKEHKNIIKILREAGAKEKCWFSEKCP